MYDWPAPVGSVLRPSFVIDGYHGIGTYQAAWSTATGRNTRIELHGGDQRLAPWRERAFDCGELLGSLEDQDLPFNTRLVLAERVTAALGDALRAA